MSSHALTYTDYSILIVDDTPVNLRVIVDYLEACGFHIRIARSGERALKRVQYDQPDLILLDVLMPGIDGFETCRRLKADAATRDIPVIFMTALTDPEDKVKGFEVGGVDYVTKPLHQEEVLARIVTHLSMRDKTRSLQEQNEQLAIRSQVEKKRLLLAVGQQHEQLRALAGKLTEVQENERRQLARELHDEMGQALTAISINLAAIKKALPPERPRVIDDRLAEAILLADQTLEQIRELSLNLRPPMLDDLGLVPTLRWYVQHYSERVDIDVGFDAAGMDDRLGTELETALYRVVQEGLTNVARHARATRAQVALQRTPSAITAYIEDDGCGFDVATAMARKGPDHGAGLLGMRERITLLGGRFIIHSAPGAGTQLFFEIPITGAATVDEAMDDGAAAHPRSEATP